MEKNLPQEIQSDCIVESECGSEGENCFFDLNTPNRKSLAAPIVEISEARGADPPDLAWATRTPFCLSALVLTGSSFFWVISPGLLTQTSIVGK